MEVIDVKNINKILNKLDWNMPLEVQMEGRELAKGVDELLTFFQPVTTKYNKNVWENCALILEERNDEQLSPYLVQMLEWIQDMNWPGAFIILDRLNSYANMEDLSLALEFCMKKARMLQDEVWEENLKMVRLNR